MKELFSKLMCRKASGTALLDVGETAPDFSVTAHDGSTVTLSDQLGKNVLLWFFRKADCPGCTVEGNGLRDSIEKYRQSDTVIFGVSFDSIEDNRGFAEKCSFPYLLLSDTSKELSLAYRACDDSSADFPRRISYLIDKTGKIIGADANVKPESHARYFLALL